MRIAIKKQKQKQTISETTVEKEVEFPLFLKSVWTSDEGNVFTTIIAHFGDGTYTEIRQNYWNSSDKTDYDIESKNYKTMPVIDSKYFDNQYESGTDYSLGTKEEYENFKNEILSFLK